jgi:hypothetical protein
MNSEASHLYLMLSFCGDAAEAIVALIRLSSLLIGPLLRESRLAWEV